MGVMVLKKGELPQERMNEAKKAHLVSRQALGHPGQHHLASLAAFIRAGK